MTTLTIPTDVDRDLYPFVIFGPDGEYVDATANVESATSVLYGDLSSHEGGPRTVLVPEGEQYDWHAEVLEQAVIENADCFDIPEDKVVRA